MARHPAGAEPPSVVTRARRKMAFSLSDAPAQRRGRHDWVPYRAAIGAQRRLGKGIEIVHLFR